MKIIDLLNKIANGEEVSKSFKIKGYRRTFIYNKETKWFEDIVDDSYCKNEIFLSELNDEIEIIEDVPKEDNKIEDKARFQYSQIPSWFDRKELIKAVNENFERHQKALNKIIDKVNGDKE